MCEFKITKKIIYFDMTLYLTIIFAFKSDYTSTYDHYLYMEESHLKF